MNKIKRYPTVVAYGGGYVGIARADGLPDETTTIYEHYENAMTAAVKLTEHCNLNTVIILNGSTSPHKNHSLEFVTNWLNVQLNKKPLIFSSDVETGVSQQPLTRSEIMLGAKNRAFNVYKKFYQNKTHDYPVFSIGIESGLVEEVLWKSFKSINKIKIYDTTAVYLSVIENNDIEHAKVYTAWSAGIEIPGSLYDEFLIDLQNDPDFTLGKTMQKKGLINDHTDVTSYLTKKLVSRSDLLVDPIKLTLVSALQEGCLL